VKHRQANSITLFAYTLKVFCVKKQFINFMSKIIIIGAKGMLGQELVRVFAGEEILAWDRDEIDITDEKMTREKILAARPDIIINAAAYNAVDRAEEDFETVNKINGYGVGFLAAAAKAASAIMIHYSTDYVFRGDKKEGYAEEDLCAPVSKYGESKLLGEQELAKNTDRYYLIRLSKLFGRMGAGEGVKKSFVDTMVQKAEANLSESETNKNECIEVVDEELSSPTYAPDLARLTKEVIDGKYPYGIYHGANSGACTWYEFAKEIFKIKKINIKVAPVGGDKFPRPAKRPRYSVLLNTKLPAQRSWQEALKKYLV